MRAIVILAGCVALAAACGRHAPTVVSIDGERWQVNGRVTYPGTAAEGLLMNVRMVNAVFEDDRPPTSWPSALPASFDPDANTAAFVARIPDYVASGVICFVVNLQGGLPGYEGAHNSAYNQDGSLREAYLARVEQVIAAASRHGAVVMVGLFYQRQHGEAPTELPRALAGRDAIRAAVRQVATWIAARGFTNVVLEISNEYAHAGFSRWQDGAWLSSPAGQIELMALARESHPGLLVSTSGMGSGLIDEGIARHADFVLLHTNTTPLEAYAARISAARAHGKPVVINEDDKVGPEGAEAARRAVAAGAGWGLMHRAANQYAPFTFAGPADDPEVYAALGTLTRASPSTPVR
jgi:hypothetical protein